LLLGLTLATPAPLRAEAPRQGPHGDPLPSGAVARLGTTRLRHDAPITSLAFRPDGKVLATAGGTTVRLWDVATGREVGSLTDDGRPIQAVAFSPDGRSLALSTGPAENQPASVALLDAATGKERLRYWLVETSIPSLAFTPDGKELVAGCGGGMLRILDTATHRERLRLPAHRDGLRGVACAPDGKTLASCAADGLRLWGVGGERTLGTGDTTGGSAVALSADALAVARWALPIVVRDLSTGEQRFELTALGRIDGLAFSPDGATLAAGGAADAVQVWDAIGGKERFRLDGHRAGATAVVWSPDGRLLATASGELVRLWDAATGREVLPREGHEAAVGFVAFAGGRLVTGGGFSVHVWDARTGRHLRRVAEHATAIQGMACSADGKLVAAWGAGEGPCLRELATGRAVGFLPAPPGPGPAFQALSPDFQVLARHRQAAPNTAYFELLDASTGELIPFAADAHCPRAGPVVFSPDGWFLTTIVPRGGGPALRHPNGARRPLDLSAKVFGELDCVAISPDGEALVMKAGPVIWAQSLAQPLQRRYWQGVTEKTNALALSPDGKALATADGDGRVRLWEVATGGERCAFAGHRGPALAVAFSPDGRLLASGGADGTILVWDLTGALTATTDRPTDTESALWDSLADRDAAKAYQAMRRLAAAPERSVALLARRLVVGEAPGPRVARLVADLDSEDFATREKASRELARLGDLALLGLRAAESSGPSLEVRRRIEDLLPELEAPEPSPERLRALRAVEVLELVGTPEAMRALRAAARSPVPWVMREAQAASLGRDRRLSP
jgi:WD40 repeat protein